ncbi:MAG TPA: hypothetical protein VIM51_05840 [Desulfosporosinus sp.]
MAFLRKKLLKDDSITKKDTIPEPVNTIFSDDPDDTSHNAPEENIVFGPAPGNLMSKLFRNHNTALSEGPESLYENEAWAPENECVGLFRKHRVNIGEPSSSSSDPQ